MSRLLKIKLVFVLVLVLLSAFAGVYWYFASYTKTPEYALKMIQTSVEEHDTEKFHRYVDLEHMLDDSYDEMVMGLVEADQPMTEEAKGAISDFAKMLKAPLISSLKMAVDQYVKNGTWDAGDTESTGSSSLLDLRQILAKTGLKGMNFRSVDAVTVDKEAGTAVASVRVYQKDADAEFVFEIIFSRKEDGSWCAEEVRNFHDFVVLTGAARHAEIDRYMEESAKIMSEHDKLMREADFDYQRILASGSLGSQETRDAIRTLMTDVVAKDWKERRSLLDELSVPNDVMSLHHLRLRICDCHIAYAEGYAKWMTDKKAGTVREADANLRQAKTLEQEARVLMKRMSSSEIAP